MMEIRNVSLPLPKHLRIKRALLERIARGDYPPGSQVPSEHEMVRMFGVSQQTAIRSLNELRAEGILRRQRGRGTFVEELSSREGVIGILRHNDETAAWRAIYAEGVQQALLAALDKRHVSPRFYHTFGPTPKGDFQALGHRVIADAKRGLLRCLITLNGYDADSVEAVLEPLGVTVIGAHTERALSKYNFGGRMLQAAETGVEYLLGQGLKKIAIIAPKGTHVPMLEYTETYLATMERHQIAIRPGWMRAEHDASPMTGYEDFKKLWAMNDRPEAVIVFDDVMAQGATRAMVELGVRVPDELKVMVLMNRGSGLTYAVPFTSLEADPGEVGAAGADLALRLLRGEKPSEPQLWINLQAQIHEVHSPLAPAPPPTPATLQPT